MTVVQTVVKKAFYACISVTLSCVHATNVAVKYSITYSESVFVFLVTLHAKWVRHIIL
jgi:hypothetical protein